MFIEIYNFFYEWLFNGVQPEFLSAQGAEFTTIIFSVITIVAVIGLAIIPIRALISWICNWR